MPTPSSPTLEPFDPFWRMHQITIRERVLNDAYPFNPDNQILRVTAVSGRKFPGPARVDVQLDGGGFAVTSRITPENARAIAEGLVAAADICDAFEAADAEAA